MIEYKVFADCGLGGFLWQSGGSVYDLFDVKYAVEAPDACLMSLELMHCFGVWVRGYLDAYQDDFDEETWDWEIFNLEGKVLTEMLQEELKGKALVTYLDVFD